LRDAARPAVADTTRPGSRVRETPLSFATNWRRTAVEEKTRSLFRLTFRRLRLASRVTDIIDALVIEHQVFRAVFDEIERELPRLRTVEEVRLLCRLVAALLHDHGDEETNLIYIALDHVLLERHQLTRLNHDHHELDAILRKVEIVKEFEEARRQLKATLIMARAHFNDEEHNVFPVIERVLHRETLLELGNAWKTRYQLAHKLAS
jgi:hemerythrin-like domain-containing protein